MLLEEAEDEVKFVDDDVFYSDEPVQVDLPPVETPIEPVVEPEVVHNAYNDIMQDLLKKQWDVINACDGIVATLSTEENITFDKEAVTSILRTLADDITASIGMTTKAMSVVDPTQDELMKEGERKADDVINASDKEVVEVGESLNETNDVWGLFAMEIDPQTGKKVADVEGGKAIETGSKEELQPKVREYESSWNVNPQGKTYRFHLKRLTSESVNEDMVNELEVEDIPAPEGVTFDLSNGEEEPKEVTIKSTFEEQMDFLAADEQEAIDGYDRIIELVEDEHVKEQLMKIKTEEIAHKEFLEKVKEDRGLEYTEPLEPEKVEEDIETVYSMNTDNWHGFDNLDWYIKYWAWEVLGHIESELENADDEELEDPETIEWTLNNLDEESLKDLCIEVANDIGNYDGLWEEVWEVLQDSIRDRISKGKYDDRITNYMSIQTGGNNNPEGENN